MTIVFTSGHNPFSCRIVNRNSLFCYSSCVLQAFESIIYSCTFQKTGFVYCCAVNQMDTYIKSSSTHTYSSGIHFIAPVVEIKKKELQTTLNDQFQSPCKSMWILESRRARQWRFKLFMNVKQREQVLGRVTRETLTRTATNSS